MGVHKLLTGTLKFVQTLYVKHYNIKKKGKNILLFTVCVNFSLICLSVMGFKNSLCRYLKVRLTKRFTGF